MNRKVEIEIFKNNIGLAKQRYRPAAGYFSLAFT